MPCPFTGTKMFCAGPNALSQPENLTAFSASSKTFVPAQKPTLLNANYLFVWHKMFVTSTICNKFLVLHKKCGPTQNILGPVKGQGIKVLKCFQTFTIRNGVYNSNWKIGTTIDYKPSGYY